MPSKEYILDRVRVDLDAGKIYRKKWHGNAKSWEYKKLAGSGYKALAIDGRDYYAHRIIFYIATGIDPKDKCIDHINGNITDNRPSNLRMVDLSTNNLNRKGAQCNSTTGVRNVHYCNTRKRFLFKKKKGNKTIRKTFTALDDARIFSEQYNKQNLGDIV